MLTVVIQAGGESRRMGQDKALIPFLGRPMIARVLQRLAPIADELIVTTNRPQEFNFLTCARVPDLMPGRGALGGVYTALSCASNPLVAVIACDMPFVNPRLVEAQCTALIAHNADLVIPRYDGRMEPLHAVYDRDICLPFVYDALQNNRWRVDAWFDQVNIHYFEKEDILKIDPEMRSFWNVNTLEEVSAAIAYAQAEEGASAS